MQVSQKTALQAQLFFTGGTEVRAVDIVETGLALEALADILYLIF